MREVFHGWRRKIGLLTLVMACSFAAGWVRSRVVPSKIPVIGWNEWHAELGDGQVIVSKERDSYIGGTKVFPGGRDFNFRNPEIERFRTYYVYPGIKYSIEKDRVSDTDSMATHVVTSLHVNLPFFAIVATLLSAWLLLSNPRAAKPKSVVVNGP